MRYKMNVSLTQELQKLVREKVRSGEYGNASEVIRDGLRLLKDRDEQRQARLDAIRNALDRGLQDLDEGRSIQGTAAELASVIKRKARGRHAPQAN